MAKRENFNGFNATAARRPRCYARKGTQAGGWHKGQTGRIAGLPRMHRREALPAVDKGRVALKNARHRH